MRIKYLFVYNFLKFIVLNFFFHIGEQKWLIRDCNFLIETFFHDHNKFLFKKTLFLIKKIYVCHSNTEKFMNEKITFFNLKNMPFPF